MSSSTFIKRDAAAHFRKFNQHAGIEPLSKFGSKKLPEKKKVITRYFYLNLQNYCNGKSKLCYKVAEELIKK